MGQTYLYQFFPAFSYLFTPLFDKAIESFIYFNQLFDIYNNYTGINNLKTINDNAGIAPVEVDPVIIELLQEAKEFYVSSNGEFDVTLGPVLKIWHKYREEGITSMQEGQLGKTPTMEELEEANKCVGWDFVEIDDENNTVYLNNSCASLDVGGIAKGFATEKVAQQLEEANIKVGIVDAGGNNRTINTKLDGSPWVVGIQSADGTADSIIAIKVEGSMSFVTSGDYQRYYIAEDGNSYNHIVDPKTLFPANYFHSVSIITNDSGVADAMSTTLFSSDFESGNEFIKKYKEEHPEIYLEAVWIMDKNQLVETDNIKEKNNYYLAYTDGLKDLIIWE